VISDRVTALEKLRVPNDVRRPLVESLQRIREAAATDPAAADRLLDELEHVLESRGILLPGQTLDKPTKDVLGGGRVADDEVRAAAEEIDALTKVSTSYIDRFTWQLSEEEAVLLQAEFPDLPARGWLQKPRLIKQQGETVIIKRGRTPERTTIPERYHPGTPSHPPVSLEVKNWPLDDVAMAENRFARSDFLLNTADQAKRRAAQLPANAEQYILIDVRGQHVDVRTQDSLARALEQMSDGALRADRVRFLTGGGTE
jgi:hypothetical protein